VFPWCFGMEQQDTLHNWSIDYVRVLAEVFGWKIETAPGSRRGPDIVIKHVNPRGDITSVMFVESEIGHDQGGAKKYFESLCKRLAERIREYRGRGVIHIVIVVITNAPRRLSEYLRKEGDKLAKELGLDYIKEGNNFYIVPAALLKKVLPAIFVRAMATDVLIAHEIVAY